MHVPGVALANQTKERPVHELFTGAFPEQKFDMWIVLVFLRKSTRIHKDGRNSWSFRFGPFFGLVCRGDSWMLQPWSSALNHVKNGQSAQRGSFWDGYPADIRGSFARISRPKTSVRALKILENKHLGADIHDPKARTSTTLRDFQKLRSEKLWAGFSFPMFFSPITIT